MVAHGIDSDAEDVFGPKWREIGLFDKMAIESVADSDSDVEVVLRILRATTSLHGPPTAGREIRWPRSDRLQIHWTHTGRQLSRGKFETGMQSAGYLRDRFW